MNSNAKNLLIVVILTQIIYWVGFFIGLSVGVGTTQDKAVKANHAIYEYVDGYKRFTWKETK